MTFKFPKAPESLTTWVVTGIGLPTVLLLVVAIGATPLAHARTIVSFALVQDDATLKVRGKIIRLYGIYVPPSGRQCETQIRPVRCASRAALALDFKKGSNFVHCTPKRKNADRSLTAICYADGVDLGAYLIERGWAVAVPDAPFEYVTLERIARKRGMGVWGFQVDSISR